MTQLRYDLMTDPFPLQASSATGAPVTARLTVVASNPKTDPAKNPVNVEGLSLSIPVGPGAAALTADATGIGPVAPEGWKLSPSKPGTGSVDYVFTPEPGKGVIGKQGLVFVFNNIKINAQPGPCQLTVKEGTTGKPTAQLVVTKFPAGWGAVSFWLDPPDVPFKGSTQLNWAGPTAATYTIQYALEGRVVNVPAQGEAPLGSQGKYPADGEPPLKLDRTTVFTLNVEESISGVRYQAQLQKTASMRVPPPSLSLEASPTRLNPSGETSVTLSWKTENVSALHIGSNVFRDKPEGSWVVTTRKPRSFLAEGYGLEGYSGPPASANASVGSLVSSEPLYVWDKPSRELWSFGLGPDRLLFKLKLNVNETPPSEWNGVREVQQTLEISFEPAANVTVADFGTAGGRVGSDELLKATYSSSPQHAKIWAFRVKLVSWNKGKNGSQQYNPPALFEVGNTWGLKSADGALALVWFEGAHAHPNHTTYSYKENSWAFDFVWIDFSSLKKLPPVQTAPEGEGGET